jgi:hypothetical protein
MSFVLKQCLKFYCIGTMYGGAVIVGLPTMMMGGDNSKHKLSNLSAFAGLVVGSTIGTICGPFLIPYMIFLNVKNKSSEKK